jgi:drug/metabolite transporter (DMT)-like permease|nr:drug/metabolite transporter [Chromohalobacter sp.]
MVKTARLRAAPGRRARQSGIYQKASHARSAGVFVLSPFALALIVVSAALHAGWNLLGKRGVPSLAFFARAMAAGSVLYAPLLLWGPAPMQLPWSFWGWLVATGACQALYMGGLAWAYARGDVSLLYPMARALPVLWVPAVALLVLPTPALDLDDGLGMGLIAISALIMPLTHWRAFRLESYLTPALGFVLLAAAGTTGYSLIDKRALGLMTASGYTPLQAGLHYMVLQAMTTWLWMWPLVRALPSERLAARRLRYTSAAHRAWLAGAMILGTYGLVLIAMSSSADVSHVVALRQLSIPLGVLAAVCWFKERLPPLRLGAIAIMLTGLALVAW